jgi:hypothetical protein
VKNWLSRARRRSGWSWKGSKPPGWEPAEVAGGRSAQGGAGEAGEGKDRGVLRTAGGEAEKAERRERASDVEKNGMEAPLAETAANARQIYRGDPN